MRHVEIQTANGHSLEGSLFMPETASRTSPGILMLHGWGGGRDRQYEAASLLSQRGFVCLGVDLRGHGRTAEVAESIRPSDNLRDGIAAHDFLVSQCGVERHCIGVAGFSYGAFLAVLLSRHRGLRWLALRAPALYRDSDIRTRKARIDGKKLALFRHKRIGPADSIALKAAAQFKGDVLVLESENDSIIPNEQVRNFIDSFQQAHSVTHVVIPGADHSLSAGTGKDFALTAVSNWFATGGVK